MFLYKLIQPIAGHLPASREPCGLMFRARFQRLVAGSIAIRWAATSFMGAEKRHRKIIGYRDLWTVETHIDEVGAPEVMGAGRDVCAVRVRAVADSFALPSAARRGVSDCHRPSLG